MSRSANTTPVRRAQLIAPFGPGSVIVNSARVSSLVSSLDFWFDPTVNNFDKRDEFIKRDDWRLLYDLGIDHYRLPPDYREEFTKGGDNREVTNANIKIPSFRFPRWHVCQACRRLRKFKLTLVESPKCDCRNRNQARFSQVRFIVVCDKGHLDDFPWNDWVESSGGECKYDSSGRKYCQVDGNLKYTAGGGSNLATVKVSCKCGKKASLLGTSGSVEGSDTTQLSNRLGRGCQGYKPWTGEERKEECDRPISTTLLNASHVYFARTRSSILLPDKKESQIQQLVNFFNTNPEFRKIRSLIAGGHIFGASELKNMEEDGELKDYSDDELESAQEIIAGSRDTQRSHATNSETDYRREELELFRNDLRSEELTVNGSDISEYEEMEDYFSEIRLVEKLTETRVLTGFDRKIPNGHPDMKPYDSRKLLWKNGPKNWLPAVVVRGEGILFIFNENHLKVWESTNQVQSRSEILRKRHETSFFNDPSRIIVPRFLLVHTFAHLLINQLVFECGYGTASLQERLYINQDEINPMAAVLIYTASGDSDGSLGGLVRMGKPNMLTRIFRTAIHNATWCASDPVCSEIEGQGLDNLNMAACHNCALLPETSCENSNMFLDRGFVVGNSSTHSRYSVSGYFEHLINNPS